MPYTILLVGYQTSFFEPLVQVFEYEGYTVLTANHDFEGGQLARRHLPNIIIYDVIRPDMNGEALRLALQLNDQTAVIPLLFLTDGQEKSLSSSTRNVEKPFTIEEILTAVNELLGT